MNFNAGYVPRYAQLWVKVDGVYQALASYYVPGTSTLRFSVNAEVEGYYLAMSGGYYGSWIVIKDIILK